ncbi:hypothetical protein [Azospirillum sp.]|uniref:hypothetical protein n=1 Tax=Azospirillum sp. TaxID=34012 RepID=UPI002D6FE9BB|nr:hypothetical protein [Azospirillum sp.]HYD65946.1 hypothetical protein [Azospirillum sp.]
MSRVPALFTALALLAGAALTAPASAADLARNRTNLPELVLGTEDGDDFFVSQKELTLEGGKFYRLEITAKGQKEYMFRAPDFMRDIWVNQIVINHLEVHPMGAPYALEFDDQGTIAIDFVPMRTGEYTWSIKGLEDKGMTGKIIVK